MRSIMSKYMQTSETTTRKSTADKSAENIVQKSLLGWSDDNFKLVIK